MSAGVKRDEDLLKGLLADDYCHLCEAVLLFESQRLSHYEVFALTCNQRHPPALLLNQSSAQIQGKKHAQRVRVYLQAKRAERTKREDAAAAQVTVRVKVLTCPSDNSVLVVGCSEGGTSSLFLLQRTMTTDKDHFCELCSMMFSSHVVATSHYEGKVHAKNIRKQGLETSCMSLR